MAQSHTPWFTQPDYSSHSQVGKLRIDQYLPCAPWPLAQRWGPSEESFHLPAHLLGCWFNKGDSPAIRLRWGPLENRKVVYLFPCNQVQDLTPDRTQNMM